MASAMPSAATVSLSRCHFAVSVYCPIAVAHGSTKNSITPRHFHGTTMIAANSTVIAIVVCPLGRLLCA